jgi:hypothetical protein
LKGRIKKAGQSPEGITSRWTAQSAPEKWELKRKIKETENGIMAGWIAPSALEKW